MLSSQSSLSSSFMSMGLNTYKVSLEDLYDANRTKLVQALRRNKDVSNKSIVYLQGGVSQTRNDTDHEPLFRQESYFLYLWGVKEPDCAASLELDTGKTTLYVPKLPEEYATFMGRIKTLEEWKDLYQVDEVLYTHQAEGHLEKLLSSATPSQEENGTTTNTKHTTPQLLLMEGRNSDSGQMYFAPTLQSPKLKCHSTKTSLFEILAECRVVKSPAELNLLQHVTELTSLGHVYTMRNTHVNMMEYQCESLFRHYCYYNFCCRLVGYTSICGCGPNSAVLHYGHAGEPNSRRIKQGELCLLDMGAEYFGYGSDVTCTFPANGKFTPNQAKVYNAVLQAQRTVYAMLRPGVSWVDCHKAAEGAILEGLIDLGIVVPNDKTIQELVDMRLGAVFMPHGLGHLIGIDTHDVGGYLSTCPPRSALPGLRSLRTARILEPDMVLTVEPGCYFIEHLLQQALGDATLKEHLNAFQLEQYQDFGGIRLEDVICVMASGFVNFTICPRTIPEVLDVMSGGKWPPTRDDAPELGRVRLTDPNPLQPAATF